MGLICAFILMVPLQRLLMDDMVETSAPPVQSTHKQVLWQDLPDEKEDGKSASRLKSKIKDRESLDIQRRIDSVYLAKKRLQGKVRPSVDELSGEFDEQLHVDNRRSSNDDDDSEASQPLSRSSSILSDKSGKSWTTGSQGMLDVSPIFTSPVYSCPTSVCTTVVMDLQEHFLDSDKPFCQSNT
jgi:hypothetical protein